MGTITTPVRCLDGNPIPSCDLTCEELICRLDAADDNITNLFNRTEDINNYLEQVTSPAPLPSGNTGWTVVTNEDQLKTAVLEGFGGMILVIGEIELTSTLEITNPNTEIWGRNDANGNRAKIILQGVSGQTQDIIQVLSTGCRLHGLEITANNPMVELEFETGTEDLVPGQQFDTAIRLLPSSTVDISGLIIEDCYIHHVTIPIYLTGSPSAIYADHIKIRNNLIQTFQWYGMFLNWNLRDLSITGNFIWGRKKSEAHAGQGSGVNEIHAVPGNGIWVGNYVQRCKINGNDIGHLDRHGIEVWNAHSTNDAESNTHIIVCGNNIHDLITPNTSPLLGRSMGVSVIPGGGGTVIGWNIIRNTTWYGVELFNADNSQGKCLVIGNRISNIIGISPYAPWGISVNSCTGALVTGNYIENVREGPFPTGISVIGGGSTGHPGLPSFDGVTISNNELVDAGSLGIVAGGEFDSPGHPGVEFGVRRRITIINNTIHFTAAREYVPASRPEGAVWLSYCGSSAVVKNNTFYYPSALPPAGTAASIGIPSWAFISGFDLIGYGTVYAGDANHAPVVSTVIASHKDIGGSNLSIQYQS